MDYIYTQNGQPIGFKNNRHVYDLGGQLVGQYDRTRVYSANGIYVGEVYKGMVVDMGNSYAPITPSSSTGAIPSSPEWRARVICGFTYVTDELLG